MAEVSNTYMPKTGTTDSGDTIYCKEDGQFKFFDLDITGAEIRNIFRSARTVNRWDIASMGTASGAKEILTPAYGTIIFQDILSTESAYMSLIAASLGDEIIIVTAGMESEAELTIGMTGINTASLFNLDGSRLSALKFSMSAANGSCFIRMKCFEEGKWSIIEANEGDHNISAMAEA